MMLTYAPKNAEHIVFANPSLSELFREIADYLDKDEIVWHILIECSRDKESDSGMFERF
jgi:hypothetical protein